MANIPEEKGGKTEDRKGGERRQDKEKGVRRKEDGGSSLYTSLINILLEYTLYTVHEMFFLCNLNIHLKAFKRI